MVQLTVASQYVRQSGISSSFCGFTFSGVCFTVILSVFYSLLFSVMKCLTLMLVFSVQDHETDAAATL